MKVGIIVQARLNSTRCPRKVLKKIYNQYTVIDFLLKRLRLSKKVDKFILAVPKSNHKIFLKIAKKNKFELHLGPEKNVLKRFYEAANKFNLNTIIRITSDSPLMDAKMIDSAINEFNLKKVDYLNNILIPSYPLGIHLEIFSFETLSKIYQKTKNNKHKEHVTPFIYNNKRKFLIYTKVLKQKLQNYRFTIDFKEDLIFFRKILNKSNKGIRINFYDVIKILKKNPELFSINNNFKKRFFLKS